MPASRGSSPPDLILELRQTPGLRLVSGAWLAAAASAVVLGSGPGWGWRLAGLLCLVPATVRLRRSRQSPTALLRLQWAGDGSWRAWDAAGRVRPLRLGPASSILGPMVVLVLHEGRRRHWLVLTPAGIGERPFRALGLRLALDRHRPADPSC